MEVFRKSSGLFLLLGFALLVTSLQGVQGEVEVDGPSESECRPYIEKALKELETGDPALCSSELQDGSSKEDVPTVEIITDDSDAENEANDDDQGDDENAQLPDESNSHEEANADDRSDEKDETQADDDAEATAEKDNDKGGKGSEEKTEAETDSAEATELDEKDDEDELSTPGTEEERDIKEQKEESVEEQDEAAAPHAETGPKDDSKEGDSEKEDNKDDETEEVKKESQEYTQEEAEEALKEQREEKDTESAEETKEASDEQTQETEASREETQETKEESEELGQETQAEESKEDETKELAKEESSEAETEKPAEHAESVEEPEIKSEEKPDKFEVESHTDGADSGEEKVKETKKEEGSKEDEEEGDSTSEPVPVEDLSLVTDIPSELRPREYVEHLLKLDEEASETEQIMNRVSDITLRELKKLYDNAIKPLEILYKYRDLSNRHFGDAEIFSKPLILFMGPWSGGKSSIINYLLNNEYNETSLRTGAEPSPAYFNILMHGDEPEVIDGTELAADYTFSGLQKFGQGLEERLRGVRLPVKLLEKVNIVEIPGILEVRKQVSRVFPFNDACQWFIDRADIIFLVYDPSKLDVGPETEAILDQLKGRESQTRIVLNKADQVKPEELMRVQGALIWNISPLMSSPQPPVMYTTSLWSRPYEPWAPVRLLQAQERAFLRDLRGAVDKRIENKIASARRFAVRVRNHAKMVDCYLTTYYNHKSVFGNRKQVADQIIEHPQDYHIYEGLSTLTNISRYDLPDPEVYKDFFKLNALYDFQQLSSTCTYFRGCPINRLDVAIAYDLPELVGTHRKRVESALLEASQSSPVPDS